MKSKNVALMAVAIAFGLVAAFITSKMGARTVEVETVQVPVATKVIPVGTALTEKNLPEYVAFRTVQKDFVPLEAVTDPKALVGKKVSRTLQATNFFMPTDVNNAPDVVLPKGYKEMSVRVTAVAAAAGFVNPGSKVDVLGHVYDKKDRSIRIPVRVLKDMLITKVDQAESRGEGPNAKPQLNMVSIAVRDEEAMKLKLFEDTGVSLLLRAENNNYDEKDTPFDIDLFKWFGINQPAEKTEEPKAAETVKTDKVIIAKKTLKMNEKVTPENFGDFFDYLEIASKLPNEAVGNQSDMMNKYLASGLTAGQIVFKDLLSDKEVSEAPKTELKSPTVVVDRKRHRVYVQQGTETIEVVYEDDGKGGWKRVDGSSAPATDPVVPKEKDAPKPDLNGEKKERVTSR